MYYKKLIKKKNLKAVVSLLSQHELIFIPSKLVIRIKKNIKIKIGVERIWYNTTYNKYEGF